MSKVYLVWQGSYSESSVVGVFSTRDGADKLAAMDMDTRVEEFEVDAMKSYAERGLRTYLMQSKGMTVEVDLGFQLTSLTEPSAEGLLVEERYGALVVMVQARDMEHATKIAADKFREYLALHPTKDHKAIEEHGAQP